MRHSAGFLLQDLVVLLIVGLALAYVVRRLVRSAKGHSDCGCGKCGHAEGQSAGPQPPAPPVVPKA